MDSECDLDPPRCDLDPQRIDLNPQSSESEHVIPDMLYESEVEEDIAADLRSSFKDRQCKWLSKPIKVVAPPSKRPCLDEVHEEPIMEAPPTSVHPPDAAAFSSVSTAASPVRAETYLAQDEAPNGPTPAEEDLDQKDAPSSIRPPSYEEMMEMLRWIPCFTDTEHLRQRCQTSFLSPSGFW